jgi:hypothetical protein
MQQTKKIVKTKHNKKRNTAFLYEVIVREITNAVLQKNEEQKKFLVKVCKSFFSRGQVLKKELDLYRAVHESYEVSNDIAQKILNEAKFQYELLDKKQIFNEQTKLVNILNKISNGSIFNTFVSDYKNLATISQIFNNSVPVKEKVLLESQIVSKMTSTPESAEKDKLVTLDSLTYNLFVKKFNEQYSNSLLSEQKELLTKYVMSFADGGTEFKLYLNEEIQRIKNSLKTSLEEKQIAEDRFLKDKTVMVLERVENYKQKDIDNSLIEEVMKIQSLIKEIESKEETNNG